MNVYIVLGLGLCFPFIPFTIYFYRMCNDLIKLKEHKSFVKNCFSNNLDKYQLLELFFSNSLKRINGWLLLSAVYTILDGLLVIWSVIFCLLNLYAIQFTDDTTYVALYSLISVMSTFIHQILNCKNKKIIYKSYWKKGCLKLNEFLYKVCDDPDVAYESLKVYLDDFSNIEAIPEPSVEG